MCSYELKLLMYSLPCFWLVNFKVRVFSLMIISTVLDPIISFLYSSVMRSVFQRVLYKIIIRDFTKLEYFYLPLHIDLTFSPYNLHIYMNMKFTYHQFLSHFYKGINICEINLLTWYFINLFSIWIDCLLIVQ